MRFAVCVKQGSRATEREANSNREATEKGVGKGFPE